VSPTIDPGQSWRYPVLTETDDHFQTNTARVEHPGTWLGNGFHHSPMRMTRGEIYRKPFRHFYFIYYFRSSRRPFPYDVRFGDGVVIPVLRLAPRMRGARCHFRMTSCLSTARLEDAGRERNFHGNVVLQPRDLPNADQIY